MEHELKAEIQKIRIRINKVEEMNRFLKRAVIVHGFIAGCIIATLIKLLSS